jgi:hypothetical protein
MKMKSLKQSVATILLGSLVGQVAVPLTALALTGGPSQPEFTDFEPVATTSMVNEFTGDFTYNIPVLSIPGPDGGGYALSLAYHSGKSGDDEASWVGKGWTLNPGAILRQKRGYPDDDSAATVKVWNKMRRNWTSTVHKKLNLEAFSWEEVKPESPADGKSKWDKSRVASVGGVVTTRYNNYKGFSHIIGLSVDVMGMVDVGYSIGRQDNTFSWSVNPAAILTGLKLVDSDVKGVDRSKNKDGHAEYRFRASAVTSSLNMLGSRNGSFFGLYTVGEMERSTSFPHYHGESWNVGGAVEWNSASLPIGFEGGISGNYTWQENEASEDIPTYGYMYTGRATSADATDYYVEKDSPYNGRDAFLSIPFSNADNYMVTGEGIGGGFRLYNRTPGHFHPRAITSSLTIGQLEGDAQLGTAMGGGIDVGLGYHRLTMGGWDQDFPETHYKFAGPHEGDEPYYFRFNNDMGGTVGFSDGDGPTHLIKKAVPVLGGGVGSIYAMEEGSDAIYPTQDAPARTGRAAYIGYNTNREMTEIPGSSCFGGNGRSYYRAYNKDKAARDMVSRGGAVASGVGEFAVTNENGARYVYGLPVYARNESDLQFGVEGVSVPNNYLAYKDVDETTAQTVLGEEHSAPYAMTYLLTSITTPDYIDRTNDGPTSDDLGGYTRFTYKRVSGSNDKSAATPWYKWRTPYNGLHYSRNSLSDPNDDLGSVSTGEKEIYYLDAVETKTHIALFKTSDRLDGFQASHNERDARRYSTASSITDGDTTANRLQKLDRIELYAKNDTGGPGKLLSVVRFEYDYSLCPGLPNAIDGAGHLTLKRLYFDYEGTISARVSPYVFGYDYKKDTSYSALSTALKSDKYYSIIHFADVYKGHPEAENPSYSPFDIDRWGYYQYKGRARDSVMNRWVDQNPDPLFDPAAWQLKWIQLPSGGEIHVQYEQNDYRYVQDRPAMAMVALHPDHDAKSPVVHDPDKFYLSLDSLGIQQRAGTGLGAPYSQEVKDLLDTLRRHFITRKERVYFRFLYSLDKSQPPDLTNCVSEYITGYANVSAIDTDNVGLYFQFPSPGGMNHPRDICRDFVATSRGGILNTSGICDASRTPIAERPDKPASMVMDLLASFTDTFFDPANVGDEIDLEHSFLRIPINRAKKGGGIRVKRILMYDRGIESGAAALYGSEYQYKDVDGNSSGVATNEPPYGREENSLITFLDKRAPQSWYSAKIISGLDREQFEGPIGESILPAASVGYSRVVVRGIHSGSTNTGFSVSEFYTVRDYPFDMPYDGENNTRSAVANTHLEDYGPAMALETGILNFRDDDQQRTQGYRFMINSMHGRIRRVDAFGGTPEGANIRISGEEYDYFKPGEELLMMNALGDTVRSSPGREMEVVFEDRDVNDVTVDASVELDFAIVAAFPPIPLWSLSASGNINRERLHTHITTKVIRYPAIVRSVKSFKDGVSSFMENLAFDPQTGNPVLVRTIDGYDGLTFGSSTSVQKGSVYAYSVPAHQQYPAMGQQAMTERRIIASGGDSLSIEKRYFNGHYLNFRFLKSSAVRSLALLTPGDLVNVLAGGANIGSFHVGTIVGSRVELLPTYIAFNDTRPVVNDVSIEIVRTARSNQLSATAGKIATYGRLPVAVSHQLP